MKIAVWIGLTLGGLAGSWVGAAMDHGNWLGGWSIILSTVGSLLGIWISYRVSKDYL